MAKFSIDLDAIAAKREEEIGSADKFPFMFKDQEWICRDPLQLSDDEKRDLQAIKASDLDGILDFYLGEEQATQFLELGGGTAKLQIALELWVAHNTDESGPTRLARSSNRMQRRSKQP